HWQNLEVLRVLVGVVGVFSADHLLVELLTRPDADHFLPGIRCNYTRQISHLHRRDFLHIYLTADHIFKGMPDQIDTFLQGNHEARHALIRDRQHTLVLNRHEERNDRSARAHDIAITHHRETRAMFARV